MKERIKWIDTAKGIAIVLVVIGHVVQSYHNVNLYEDSVLFNFSSRFVYSFHMPLFMCISSYLLQKSVAKNFKSIKNRLVGIAIICPTTYSGQCNELLHYRIVFTDGINPS